DALDSAAGGNFLDKIPRECLSIIESKSKVRYSRSRVTDQRSFFTTSTTIIPADTKSKDKGKGIMVEEPKPLKKKQQVEMDEEYARKLHEELNKDIE
nr:hypothetical protein [Tanacetum cinerariifolium]